MSSRKKRIIHPENDDVYAEIFDKRELFVSYISNLSGAVFLPTIALVSIRVAELKTNNEKLELEIFSFVLFIASILVTIYSTSIFFERYFIDIRAKIKLRRKELKALNLGTWKTFLIILKDSITIHAKDLSVFIMVEILAFCIAMSFPLAAFFAYKGMLESIISSKPKTENCTIDKKASKPFDLNAIAPKK